ncbi:putative membrane protein (plasmid) [Burkholderia gladioli]|uniref:Membrane protein n=1 Tax=Burkholderia gladioli TaxID=28095 RepID=A0AAW3FBG4_BURGA|nr:hypothetical protein [Burkholderia gladioli]AJW93627.1 putative membrane protein [Burkholderia gladioli]AWY53004.1 hypothetical protein A8H28_17025 [Burkholderia gladioli pv. gladioli]KGC24020.1 putative membrane protein [Burkholderia gladioli]
MNLKAKPFKAGGRRTDLTSAMLLALALIGMVLAFAGLVYLGMPAPFGAGHPGLAMLIGFWVPLAVKMWHDA